jgi:serine/threonine-protein kinase
MAPEQVLSSRRVDARADLWALAMTLYHALAGEPPLERHATFTELVLALTMQPIPPLQESAPWVTPGLAAVVHGALLRETEARCPTIDEFLRALAPHAGGSDDVTAGMLVGLPEEQRRQVQPLLLTPSTWQEALAHNREADPLLGKTLAGKYELVKILGEGGMGAVYEARTPQGESFACKVIRPDLVGSSPDAMRRLMREARTSMRLVSPNVVRVIEVDNDMGLGLPFILMELLQGFDLSTLVASQGPLAPPAACRLFVDACRGLAVAHREGVIHRDIKPANLFLHQTGGPSEPLVVKVCDFGIAKQTDSEAYGNTSTELTRTGGLLGSPLYMSPEQARNAKTVDHRTDIWSLCLSLYEALTGQKAWQGFNSPGELVLAICTQEIRPIQDVAPWISPGLADIVHRGMHRDPAQRHPTIEALAQALEPHASSCPVLTLEALALSDHQKEIIAERSPHSRRSSIPGATADSTRDVLPPSIPPRPSLAPRAAAVGAVVAAILGAAWMLRSPQPQETLAAVQPLPVSAERQPTATAPTVIPVSDLVVRLPVSPPQASVTVQGKPQSLRDGAVELTGKPGDSFQVVLDVEGQRREIQVILTSDGKAMPPSLEGPSKAAKTAAKGPATPPATANPGGAKAAATKADPPPGNPGGLGQQKDWRLPRSLTSIMVPRSAGPTLPGYDALGAAAALAGGCCLDRRPPGAGAGLRARGAQDKKDRGVAGLRGALRAGGYPGAADAGSDGALAGLVAGARTSALVRPRRPAGARGGGQAAAAGGDGGAGGRRAAEADPGAEARAGGGAGLAHPPGDDPLGALRVRRPVCPLRWALIVGHSLPADLQRPSLDGLEVHQHLPAHAAGPHCTLDDPHLVGLQEDGASAVVVPRALRPHRLDPQRAEVERYLVTPRSHLHHPLEIAAEDPEDDLPHLAPQQRLVAPAPQPPQPLPRRYPREHRRSHLDQKPQKIRVRVLQEGRVPLRAEALGQDGMRRGNLPELGERRREEQASTASTGRQPPEMRVQIHGQIKSRRAKIHRAPA